MPQFWKVRNMLFWEGKILQNSAQKLGVFPLHTVLHLSWYEVPPMFGVCNIIYLSGNLSDWQIIMSMYMYSTVELFTTIAVLLSKEKCGMFELPQCLKVMNMLFWEGRILQNLAQKLGEFPPHSYSHMSWFGVPCMLRVCDITCFSCDISAWQIINSTHMYSTV